MGYKYESMKRLAIFDFDGTLVDSVWDVEICFNQTLESLGFPTLTHEEYLDRLGGNIDEIVSLILNDENTPENIELVKDAYGKLYSASPKDNTLPFPNTHEILRILQDRGLFLAVNSNRKNDSLNHYLDKFFADIEFVAVEGHNDSYPSKPSPCAVERILDELGIAGDDAIYVGDSMTDIKTAQNAGIDCVLVSWGYGRRDAFESEYPLKTVDDACELLEII